MKYLLLMLIALASFLLSMAAVLALTGNLSGEKLQSLAGLSDPPTAGDSLQAALQDPLNPLAQELKQKEATLREREKALAERDAQLAQREKELQELRQELEAMQAEITGALDEQEAEREVRLQATADTVAAMDADTAAITLQSMTPEDVADILALMDVDDRGDILGEMQELQNPEGATAAQVLRALRENRL